MDLIGALTSQLGLDPKQATGAAGAIFGAIQAEVPAADFGALTAKVPEAAEWMRAAGGATAPASGGLGALLGGAGGGLGAGLLGSAAQTLGGAGGGLGALATLLPTLQRLNLKDELLPQLAPIVVSFLQARLGGDGLAKLTQGSPILGQLASMAGGAGGGGVAGVLGKLLG